MIILVVLWCYQLAEDFTLSHSNQYPKWLQTSALHHNNSNYIAMLASRGTSIEIHTMSALTIPSAFGADNDRACPAQELSVRVMCQLFGTKYSLEKGWERDM